MGGGYASGSGLTDPRGRAFRPEVSSRPACPRSVDHEPPIQLLAGDVHAYAAEQSVGWSPQTGIDSMCGQADRVEADGMAVLAESTSSEFVSKFTRRVRRTSRPAGTKAPPVTRLAAIGRALISANQGA